MDGGDGPSAAADAGEVSCAQMSPRSTVGGDVEEVPRGGVRWKHGCRRGEAPRLPLDLDRAGRTDEGEMGGRREGLLEVVAGGGGDEAGVAERLHGRRDRGWDGGDREERMQRAASPAREKGNER